MSTFASIKMEDKDIYHLGQYEWFGKGPDHVYANDWIGELLDQNLAEDKFNEIRKLWSERIDKVFDTTAGSDLIPVYLEPEIIDITRKQTPFLNLLKRSSMISLDVNVQRITALNQPTFESEGATMTTQDETYDRVTKSAKYMYSIGEVSGQMKVAGEPYVYMLQESIRNHTVSLRRFEEERVLLGEKTDSSLDPFIFNTNGFDGFFKIIHDYDTQANENDLAGAASIQLTDVRDAIALSEEKSGYPSVIVCDVRTYYDLKGQIQDMERFVNLEKIGWGMTSYTLDGIPVIRTKSIPSTAGEKALVVLDMSVIEMKVLQDATYEPLGKIKDTDKYMIKEYGVPIDRSNGKFHATIIGGA